MIPAWMVRLASTGFCLWYMLHARGIDWAVLVVLGALAINNEVTWILLHDLRKRVKALEEK